VGARGRKKCSGDPPAIWPDWLACTKHCMHALERAAVPAVSFLGACVAHTPGHAPTPCTYTHTHTVCHTYTPTHTFTYLYAHPYTNTYTHPAFAQRRASCTCRQRTRGPLHCAHPLPEPQEMHTGTAWQALRAFPAGLAGDAHRLGPAHQALDNLAMGICESHYGSTAASLGQMCLRLDVSQERRPPSFKGCSTMQSQARRASIFEGYRQGCAAQSRLRAEHGTDTWPQHMPGCCTHRAAAQERGCHGDGCRGACFRRERRNYPSNQVMQRVGNKGLCGTRVQRRRRPAFAACWEVAVTRLLFVVLPCCGQCYKLTQRGQDAYLIATTMMPT